MQEDMDGPVVAGAALGAVEDHLGGKGREGRGRVVGVCKEKARRVLSKGIRTFRGGSG